MFMENKRFTDYLRKRNIEFASFQTLVIPVIEQKYGLGLYVIEMATGKLRILNGNQDYAERLQGYLSTIIPVQEGQEKPPVWTEIDPDFCGTLKVCQTLFA
jgi:hypothetical protein